ncbi:MAG: hypothetical protein EAZ95_20495, partial [Bacteroidetes bacterium]
MITDLLKTMCNYSCSRYMKAVIFFLLLWAVGEVSYAQSPAHIFSWGAQMHYGSIFAHSKSVENTAGSRPFGVEANAIWQKISQ